MSDLETALLTVIDRYSKMLLQALPGTDTLSFDDVAPRAQTASGAEMRRVAAAAFYHCLGACLCVRWAV